MDDKNDLNAGAPEASASPSRAPHAGGGGAEAGPKLGRGSGFCGARA